MPSTPPTAEASLHRQLRLRDLVLTQVLCVVGSSWVGIAAGLGRAQALTWIAAMVLFYLPMAVSVIYLNREMPLEGGLYVWARTAFGDLGGFMTAWNLWFYGIAVTATILYTIPTELSYLIGPSGAWLPENHLASFAIVAVVVLGITAAAVRGLELGKWIHNIGGISILAVYCALIILPFWAMARHQPIHCEPLPLQLPQPNMISLALFGQMLFGALCGLEYIAILAGESKDAARSIGQSVVFASPMICAMFIAGTSSVLAFSRGPIDFIAPIPQTLRYALGNSGIGNLFAMTAILLLPLISRCSPSHWSEPRRYAPVYPAGSAGPPSPASAPRSSALSSPPIPLSTSSNHAPTPPRSSAPTSSAISSATPSTAPATAPQPLTQARLSNSSLTSIFLESLTETNSN